MECVLYKSIEEINQEEWDSIIGRDRIICSHGYWAAIEKSNICDCDYFYPVVLKDGNIVAHTCIYSMSFELDIFAKGAVKKIIKFIRKYFPNFLILKFIECGTPVALGNTISFAEEVDKEESLKLIVKKMEEVGRKKKIDLLLLRDFYDRDLSTFNCLKADRFNLVSNLPNTEFDLKWDSFDEYLNAMRCHYRHNIKRNLKKIVDNKLTIEIKDNFSNLSEELVGLWKNCYDNAREYRREVLTKEFFTNIDTYLGGKSKLVLIKNDAKILGYGLVLDDDLTVRTMFIGIDYTFNKMYGIYFNIWYNLFDYCMRQKKKFIDMGLTTYQAKLSLGGRIAPLYMYMRHNNSVFNLLLTKLFVLMTPVKKYDTKNGLKQ